MQLWQLSAKWVARRATWCAPTHKVAGAHRGGLPDLKRIRVNAPMPPTDMEQAGRGRTSWLTRDDETLLRVEHKS
jgi:hypothetical protein